MSDLAKQSLAASLKKLLMTQRIDKITIKELTDDCGISRAAFYYHFRDIYDLVEWIFIKEFIEPYSNDSLTDSWSEKLRYILEKMYKERDFVYRVFKYINYKQLQDSLYVFAYKFLYEIIESKYSDRKIEEDIKRSIADFYKYNIIGIMFDWFDKGMSEPPDKVAGKISHYIIDGIDHLVNISVT